MRVQAMCIEEQMSRHRSCSKVCRSYIQYSTRKSVVSGFAEAEWLGVCLFTFTIVCGKAIVYYIALPG